MHIVRFRLTSRPPRRDPAGRALRTHLPALTSPPAPHPKEPRTFHRPVLHHLMPRLGAEERHVDHRHRIIRQHRQFRPHGHALQPLAQPQNGQGADQPARIYIDLVHDEPLPASRHGHNTTPDHADVTTGQVTRPVTCAIGKDMFDTSVIDVGLLPALFLALSAGFVSFLSPCVLPIVPPYIAYMSGVTLNDLGEGHRRGRALTTAGMFVLGLSTVFLLLGFTASVVGTLFLQYQEYFNTVAGILVMIFGAHFLGVYRIGFLDREARLDAGDRGGSAFGAYVLGLAFAFGWTPCIGPQLGAILSLAASEASVARGTTLLAVYAAGLGIPFLLVAAFLPRLTGTMNWMKRNMERIERIMGLLLWTIGLLMLTGGFSAMSFWLLETFPGLATLG